MVAILKPSTHTGIISSITRGTTGTGSWTTDNGQHIRNNIISTVDRTLTKLELLQNGEKSHDDYGFGHTQNGGVGIALTSGTNIREISPGGGGSGDSNFTTEYQLTQYAPGTVAIQHILQEAQTPTSGASKEINITITEVADINKCELLLTMCAGELMDGTTSLSQGFKVGLTGTTNLRITMLVNNGSQDYRIMAQVIEHLGAFQ